MELILVAPFTGQPAGSIHANVHNNDEAWVSTILYINNIFLQDIIRATICTEEKESSQK